MKAAQPIRNMDDIKNLENYFYDKGEYRNYFLVILGLNTALRISDLLRIKFNDIYDFRSNQFKTHIVIQEKKTHKEQIIYINDNIQNAFNEVYKKKLNINSENDYIFTGKKNVPISRIQVNNILGRASFDLNIQHISCHSLRKTFGYQAWKTGASPALLMQIYNHSNYSVTKRYLGIVQEDKDELFKKISL